MEFARKYPVAGFDVKHARIEELRRSEDIMGLNPLVDKWRAFGWSVCEIDGHEQ